MIAGWSSQGTYDKKTEWDDLGMEWHISHDKSQPEAIFTIT